jgi:NADH:ubiquinone oxidoreductase subunit F (NADH-binding)
MVSKGIIAKLKKEGLVGRSGSCFPTGLKWEMVKKNPPVGGADKKYIICNASEGEPDVFKDKFILENYPGIVVEGIKIALETIDNSSAYIYLNKDYYKKFKNKLEKLIKGLPITLFKKMGGYLAGEETSVISVIEGGRPEPKIRPPYPTQSGLFNRPTLVNNVETFYSVAKIARGEYKKTRFYSITLDGKKKGVYELPESYSISEILKETKNWPDFDFFVQVGGGASGIILLPNELSQKVSGIGSIIVFNRKKTDPYALMKKWAKFFLNENCDRCVPCREGVYRIYEMLEQGKIDRKTIDDIFFVLKETSFCPLGRAVVYPFSSLINKLLDEKK